MWRKSGLLLLFTPHRTQGFEGQGDVGIGTHPEGRLHLGFEDVTLKTVREHRRGVRRVKRLFGQLLLLSLAGEQGVKKMLNFL